MKAAAFFGKKDIRIVEVAAPTAGSDGVVVHMRACGICGTDMHVYNSGLFVEVCTSGIDGHRIIGHEFAGDLVEVSADAAAAGWRVGDRVVSVHNKGGLAEYVHIPGRWLRDLHRIPSDLPYTAAATVEPFCNPVHSFHQREPHDGETVAIFGAGVIGLGYLQMVKAHTRARTIVVDISPRRLEIAGAVGADVMLDARSTDPIVAIKQLTGEYPVRYSSKTAGGCDIAIDCAGRPRTLAQALEVVKPQGGAVLLAGIFEETLPFDPNLVLFKHMTIHASMGYTPAEAAEAVRLIAGGVVRREILVSHTFPLAEVEEAFRIQGNSSVSVKVVLVNE
jgi:threonine dehydrogenase-like Zn-dependent dehydrogenase